MHTANDHAKGGRLVTDGQHNTLHTSYAQSLPRSDLYTVREPFYRCPPAQKHCRPPYDLSYPLISRHYLQETNVKPTKFILLHDEPLCRLFNFPTSRLPDADQCSACVSIATGLRTLKSLKLIVPKFLRALMVTIHYHLKLSLVFVSREILTSSRNLFLTPLRFPLYS